MTPVREAFLTCAGVLHDLARHELVRERWNEAGALAEMTVGAVAGHAARALFRVEDLLHGEVAPPADVATVSAAQYYLTFTASAAESAEVDAGIRQRAAEEAAAGLDDLLWRIGETVARLQQRLATEPPDRHIGLPSGRPMLLDDYLRTRIVELTVHVDDLAVSIGVSTPPLPQAAMDEAISTLVSVAMGRHGDLAVLRALTRAERDEVQALRVL